MKRLFILLGLVGTGLAGGLYLTVEEGVDEERNMSCRKLERRLNQLKDTEQIFYLFTDGTLLPPNQFNEHVLGDREPPGKYTIGSVDCDASYSWRFKRSDRYNGKRLFKAKPPFRFGKTLKRWCESEAGCDWLGSPRRMPRLLKALRPAVYLDMIRELSNHFAQETTLPHLLIPGKQVRQTCINGLLYGPGIGGSEPCALDETWVPFDAGRAHASERAQVQFTDEELEAE